MRKQRIMGHLRLGRDVPGRRTAPLLILGLVALVTASAAAAQPKGAFAVFAQCPVKAANIDGCIYSPIESGHITLGKEEIPIVNKQIIQGGMSEANELFVKHLVGALNGETLTKTPQAIPGGLAGLVKCKEISELFVRFECEIKVKDAPTAVNAVPELAAPASSIALSVRAEEQGEGTALTLPVKVRLENPLLGGECYIGSNTEPITLNLTTGKTTGGPTGKPGTKSTKEEGKIEAISETSLVSNTFTAPKATGCGSLGLFDGTIDSKIGLPSAAGKNTAVLNGKVELADSQFVEESER